MHMRTAIQSLASHHGWRLELLWDQSCPLTSVGVQSRAAGRLYLPPSQASPAPRPFRFCWGRS
jgi:hypothetical protein